MKTEEIIVLIILLIFVGLSIVSYKGTLKRETKVGHAVTFGLDGKKGLDIAMGQPLETNIFAKNKKQFAGYEKAKSKVLLPKEQDMQIVVTKGEVKYSVEGLEGDLKEGEEAILQLGPGEIEISLINLVETSAEVIISFN